MTDEPYDLGTVTFESSPGSDTGDNNGIGWPLSITHWMNATEDNTAETTIAASSIDIKDKLSNDFGEPDSVTIMSFPEFFRYKRDIWISLYDNAKYWADNEDTLMQGSPLHATAELGHELQALRDDYGLGKAQAMAVHYGYNDYEHFAVGSNGEFAAMDEFDVMSVSEGIDVTDGMYVIDFQEYENVPVIAVPKYNGMEDITVANDPLVDDDFHYYSAPVQMPTSINGRAGLEAVEISLINNPTPGKDNPATSQGTVNDVGGLSPTTYPLDFGSNEVFSFVVENDQSTMQTDFVVNVAINGEHIAADGYVARYGELNPNGSITLHTVGEGNASIQDIEAMGLDEFATDQAIEAWEQNAAEIISQADGFLQ